MVVSGYRSTWIHLYDEEAMSKADARDWQEQQRADRYMKESFDDAKDKLYYAGCKRSMMPDPMVFEKAGHPEVARKIRTALSMLDDAYNEVQDVELS